MEAGSLGFYCLQGDSVVGKLTLEGQALCRNCYFVISKKQVEHSTGAKWEHASPAQPTTITLLAGL